MKTKEHANKIGIITYYYDSINYGGNLQAYALTKVIKNLGENAVQICYDYRGVGSSDLKSANNQKKSIRRRLYDLLYKIKSGELYLELMNQIGKGRYTERNRAILEFNRKIPHSEQVYNDETIIECVPLFDLFITGSDMVWYWPNKSFFLNFTNKTKISYAAGVSRSALPVEHQVFYRNSLKDYQAISVRDKTGLELIQKILNKKIEYLLDPTLLLTSADWDQVASHRIIKDKYIFCYFLDDSKEIKQLACKYARRKKIKIVTIADFRDCSNGYLKNDRLFDIRLYKISPKDFISLIKYAEYVFTDSFHGMAFSTIYHKQFFVFERVDKVDLLIRITDLANVLDCENRICAGEKRHTIDYLISLADYNYLSIPQEFYDMRNQSIDYLVRNICTENDRYSISQD